MVTTINADDVTAYATFLEADRAIKAEYAKAVAAFMILSRSLDFVLSPKIWAAEDELLGPTRVRVYFDPWSQNRFSAAARYSGFYFCAERISIFAYSKFYPHPIDVIKSPPAIGAWSGAKTRRAFNQMKEEIICLKNQLAAMC